MPLLLSVICATNFALPPGTLWQAIKRSQALPASTQGCYEILSVIEGSSLSDLIAKLSLIWLVTELILVPVESQSPDRTVQTLKTYIFCIYYCICIYLIKWVVLKQSKTRSCIWFCFLLIKTEYIYLEDIIINWKTPVLKNIFLIYLGSNTNQCPKPWPIEGFNIL